MFRSTINEFFAPADTVGGGDETLDEILNEEDEESTEEDTSKEISEDVDSSGSDEDTDETDDERDELAELEESLKEPDESKLEATTNFPRRKDVLKKYPNFYKDFPEYETAVYREQAFTKIFSNPADAQESLEKAQALDNFDAALMAGETKAVFKSVKDSDPNAFYNLVDNLMDHLGEVDEQAQIHVIRNIAKNLISGMVSEAGNSGNEALKHAAVILNQFAFGTSQYEPPTKLGKAPAKNEESESFNKERQEFYNQRLETSRTELIQRVDNIIVNTINKDIDPKDSMPSFVKNAAIKESKAKLNELLGKDTRLRSVLNTLWTRARTSNYAKKDVDAIYTAYTNRAKLLLPTVLKSVRSEALKGIGRKVVNKEEDDDIISEPSVKKAPSNPGKSASPNSGKTKGGMPEGMSIRQYLEADD